MTLLLGIVADWGAWLGSDHRLTDAETGGAYENPSVKQAWMKCRDGSLLIAYTGIGRFQHPTMGQIDVSDWVRRSLRGRQYGVDETVDAITECTNARLAKPAKTWDMAHSFVLIAARHDTFQVGEITNMSNLTESGVVTSRFGSWTVERTGSVVIRAGHRDAVSVEDLEMLRRLSGKHPSSADDYMRVLAEVNRRAARRSTVVSESCTISYMPPAGEPIKQVVYNAGADEEVPSTPMMLFSIDVTDIARAMTAGMAGGAAPGQTDEWAEATHAAAEASLRPEDC